MKNTDYEKAYEDLRARYKDMPDYDTFNSFVEVSFITYDIYDNKLMARFFRRLCESKLGALIGFIQDLLQPNQLISREEAASLSDEQKKQLNSIMKEFMALYRSCGLLNYNSTEQSECNKIVQVISLLKEREDFMKEIFDHLQLEWEKVVEETSHKDYKYIQ